MYGQLAGVGSPHPPHGAWGSNSGCQDLWESHLNGSSLLAFKIVSKVSFQFIILTLLRVFGIQSPLMVLVSLALF